jgi:hypothetical protein
VRKVRSRLKKARTVSEIRSERADRGQLPSASKLLKQSEFGGIKYKTTEKRGKYLKIYSEDGGGEARRNAGSACLRRGFNFSIFNF